MSAVVEVDERNGAGAGILTHNPANSNMGNVDAAALDPVAYPITPGENSYEKYQILHVTDMGGSSQINNIKIWRNGALGGAATHKTNARLTSYGGAASYAEPVKTASSIATQTMPSSVPATANLGIGGALAGALTDVGYSDYLVHQIQTNAADVAGSTSEMDYQYDEVA
jgi:hypothetical protein